MKLKHIQHLYWRAGFGILPNQLHTLSKKNRKDIIDNLFRASKKITPLKVDTSEIDNILLYIRLVSISCNTSNN